MSSTNHEAPHCAVVSSPTSLPPSQTEYPLITLFSNTLSLYPSLKMKHHVSHPYTATGKVVIEYSLLLKVEAAGVLRLSSAANFL